MHRNLTIVFLALGLSVVPVMPAQADMLVLKDGRVIQGDFVGGSTSFIQFQSDSVTVSYPLYQVVSLNLSPRPESTVTVEIGAVPPGVALPTAEVVAVPGGEVINSVSEELPPGSVVVPAGSKMVVTFSKTVSTKSNKKGSSFQATLDQDLMVNGAAAAPKGTIVSGLVTDSRGGKKLGAQYLKLSLTGMTIHNQKIPLVSEEFGVEGGNGIPARVTGASLAGAKISQGEKGEGVELVINGNHVQFPAGTVLEVTLKEAVALIP